MIRYRGKKVRIRRKGLVRLKLRQILQERGITGYAFAKYSGLSMNTIYRLTRPTGRFELIQADTMERICGALRITPTELFDYKV
jgi:DNA-binding Xre family transcriptional regulator